MNGTTVRNIAITIASTVITGVQLNMAHRDRQRDHAWAKERATHEQRAQEVHEDHMRWSRGIPTPTN